MTKTENQKTKELAAELSDLNRFFAPEPPPVRVEFGARSHPGRVRPNNQDQWLVVRRRRTRDVLMTSLPEGWLPSREEYAYAMIVADGMGGAAFGEVASMLAISEAFQLGFTEIKWPVKITEQEIREIYEKLEAYGTLLHRQLLSHIEEDPSLSGMGTTLTAAYTVGLDAFIGHVGDSRAYLFHNKSIMRLTKDHTLSQQLVDKGVFSPESAEARRLSHVLTNCLGAGLKHVRVDVAHVSMDYGDSILLCTDGLSDLVTDEEMAGILSDKQNAQDACNVLLDLAMDRGGPDNITVVVGKYESP
jgi:protein phosphatase